MTDSKKEVADLYRQVYRDRSLQTKELVAHLAASNPPAEKSEGRLIDLIMHSQGVKDLFKDQLDGVVVINASNVGRYYWEESDQEDWDMKDFPNVAPPFPRFWLDFNAPDRVVSSVYGEAPWPHHQPTHWGFDIYGLDLRNEKEKQSYLLTLDTGIGGSKDYILQHLDRARWAMDMWLYIRLYDKVIGPVWLWRLLVDEQGQSLYNEKKETIIVTGTIHPTIAKEIEDLSQHLPLEQAQDAMYRKFLTHFHTGLLAISFLHCKNVSLEDIKPPFKTVHNRGQKKRGVQPYQPVPYKVLNIQPMKQVLHHEGRSATNGSKKALHICRGHFKHYGNGRGLFGKYKGTYWFPQQVRGEKKRGVTTKDYNIII